jgi:hypothetical protein
MAAEARLKADRMDSMATQWEAGVVGEQRVAAALAPLAGEHCSLLHDRLLDPGRSRVNLDHVVLSVAGNYLIDAKNWSGEVSVHQGSLRQRTARGGGRLLDEQVDKVRRMAERMESSTSCVVEPVICLAGEKSAEFGEPSVVRGVLVVPVDRLASWLLTQPRSAAVNDLRNLTVRFAASFPSATEPAFLSIPPARGDRAGQPSAPGLVNPRAGRARKRPPAGQRPPAGKRPPGGKRPRSGSHRARLASLLLILAVSLFLSTAPGQQVLKAGGEAAGGHFASQVNRAVPTPTLSPWVSPCTAVSDAAVAKAVGHTVYRYLNGIHDSCSWGFAPRPNPAAPGSIRLVTGWNAKHHGYPAAGTARYHSDPAKQVLAVPQFVAVPGSAVPSKLITQPILVEISWRSSPVSSAQARLAVAVLAGEVAKRMPIGPQASAITLR